ncbi:uncharacterized protein LOC128956817 [Oppia nitens]|uniref:uncharacterized protein LOC128956817 n=1 Tax=Oppia nitens TaxID=1686743 RepID=UPI0023DB27E1|nr:uncharacterized protein LOC128956817 [Oppia nitens]
MAEINNELNSELENRYMQRSFDHDTLRLIGSGQFSKIYLVKHRNNDKQYAIKKIEITEITGFGITNIKQIYNSIKRGMKLWSQMDSECFVRYNYSWLSLDDNKYYMNIQMDLCWYSLDECIKQMHSYFKDTKPKTGWPSVGYYMASEMFVEILEAINYIHKQEIIHRSIKPTNILIINRNNHKFIKLADFGYATEHESSSQSHTMLKIDDKYMAPEVKRSRKYCIKSDMYSIGGIAQDLFNIDINSKFKNNLDDDSKQMLDICIVLLSGSSNERHTCDYLIKNNNKWIKDYESVRENIIKMIEIGHQYNHHDQFVEYFLENKTKQYLPTETLTMIKLSRQFSDRKFSANSDNNNNDDKNGQVAIYKNGHYLDQFTEIDKIGSGGFGQVYKVCDKNQNKFYAIKIIQLSGVSEKEIIYFRNEIKYLKQVSDSIYAVQCIDSWLENNQLYIQMDLGDFNLRTLIDFKRQLLQIAHDQLDEFNEIDHVDYAISYEIFRELIECLNYLHQQQPKPIMHRDIKPANILLTIEPRSGRFVRLADFGLAKEDEGSQISHTKLVGTEKYMPPEVRHSGHYNTSADVYCLGEVAFVLFDKIQPSLSIEAPVAALKYHNWLSVNNSRQLFPNNPNHIRESANVIEGRDYRLQLDSEYFVRYYYTWLTFTDNKYYFNIQMDLCWYSLDESIKQMHNYFMDTKPKTGWPSVGYYMASEMFVEILESINYIHKQNIIHRSIKPTNILIINYNNYKFIKLSDFGYATEHESSSQSHTMLSIDDKYMAPEVKRSRKYCIKSDMYSIGGIAQDLFNVDINWKLKNNLDNDSKQMLDICIVLLSGSSKGAFGYVYKVCDNIENKFYAIKIIELSDRSNTTINYFSKEIKYLKQVSDSIYAVKCWDSWLENNQLYIQMDLGDFNLRTLIDYKRLILELAKIQLKPIMHRDIKPKNILLTVEPRSGRFVRLADFGLAKEYDGSDINYTQGVGTPGYRALELITGKQYNTMVDVYSLGETAYILFEQIQPSDGLTENLNAINKLIVSMFDGMADNRPKCDDILNQINKLAINQQLLQPLLECLTGKNDEFNLYLLLQ